MNAPAIACLVLAASAPILAQDVTGKIDALRGRGIASIAYVAAYAASESVVIVASHRSSTSAG